MVAETERRLQRLRPDRPPRDAEDAAELLRQLGDLSTAEALRARRRPGLAAPSSSPPGARSRSGSPASSGGSAIEDAGRFRDALGVALPAGIAARLTWSRSPTRSATWSPATPARTAPFAAADCAARFGLGVAVVEQALRRLAATGRVVAGEFTPGGAGTEWCDAEVLRLLRRRSLAALRKEIEPVPPGALARFLPAWQQVGSGPRRRRSGGRGRAAAGLRCRHRRWSVSCCRPGSPTTARATSTSCAPPARWSGPAPARSAGGDGWVRLAYADIGALLLPAGRDAPALTPLHAAVLAALEGGQALFFRALADRVALPPDADRRRRVWDLVWAGHLSNDTLGTAARAAVRWRRRAPGAAEPRGTHPATAGPAGRAGDAARRRRRPTVAGRWYRLPERDTDPTRRAAALADALLERHGVVTRGAVTPRA